MTMTAKWHDADEMARIERAAMDEMIECAARTVTADQVRFEMPLASGGVIAMWSRTGEDGITVDVTSRPSEAEIYAFNASAQRQMYFNVGRGDWPVGIGYALDETPGVTEDGQRDDAIARARRRIIERAPWFGEAAGIPGDEVVQRPTGGFAAKVAEKIKRTYASIDSKTGAITLTRPLGSDHGFNDRHALPDTPPRPDGYVQTYAAVPEAEAAWRRLDVWRQIEPGVGSALAPFNEAALAPPDGFLQKHRYRLGPGVAPAMDFGKAAFAADAGKPAVLVGVVWGDDPAPTGYEIPPSFIKTHDEEPPTDAEIVAELHAARADLAANYPCRGEGHHPLGQPAGIRPDATAVEVRGIPVSIADARAAWSRELRRRVEASEAARRLTVYGPIDDPEEA